MSVELRGQRGVVGHLGPLPAHAVTAAALLFLSGVVVLVLFVGVFLLELLLWMLV